MEIQFMILRKLGINRDLKLSMFGLSGTHLYRLSLTESPRTRYFATVLPTLLLEGFRNFRAALQVKKSLSRKQGFLSANLGKPFISRVFLSFLFLPEFGLQIDKMSLFKTVAFVFASKEASKKLLQNTVCENVHPPELLKSFVVIPAEKTAPSVMFSSKENLTLSTCSLPAYFAATALSRLSCVSWKKYLSNCKRRGKPRPPHTLGLN